MCPCQMAAHLSTYFPENMLWPKLLAHLISCSLFVQNCDLPQLFLHLLLLCKKVDMSSFAGVCFTTCCAGRMKGKMGFCAAPTWFLCGSHCFSNWVHCTLSIISGCCACVLCSSMCACMLSLSRRYYLISSVHFFQKYHGVQFGDFSHTHGVNKILLLYNVSFENPSSTCMVVKSNPAQYSLPP